MAPWWVLQYIVTTVYCESCPALTSPGTSMKWLTSETLYFPWTRVWFQINSNSFILISFCAQKQHLNSKFDFFFLTHLMLGFLFIYFFLKPLWPIMCWKVGAQRLYAARSFGSWWKAAGLISPFGWRRVEIFGAIKRCYDRKWSDKVGNKQKYAETSSGRIGGVFSVSGCKGWCCWCQKKKKKNPCDELIRCFGTAERCVRSCLCMISLAIAKQAGAWDVLSVFVLSIFGKEEKLLLRLMIYYFFSYATSAKTSQLPMKCNT